MFSNWRREIGNIVKLLRRRYLSRENVSIPACRLTDRGMAKCYSERVNIRHTSLSLSPALTAVVIATFLPLNYGVAANQTQAVTLERQGE